MSKLIVHERAPARSFDPVKLHGYHLNDPELVASRLLDPQLARRNRVTLDCAGWQHSSIRIVQARSTVT